MIKQLSSFKIIATLLMITLIHAQKPLVAGQDTSNFATGVVSVPTSDCYQVIDCLNVGGGGWYTVTFPGTFTSNG